MRCLGGGSSPACSLKRHAPARPLIRSSRRSQTRRPVQVATMGYAAFAAGCAAGIAEVIVGHPFDTVKAKLQTQRTTDDGGIPSHTKEEKQVHFRGPIHCAMNIMRSDGIAGLYAGVEAPLVQKALGISFLMGTMTFLRNALGADLFMSPLRWLVACFIMGLMESIIYCPLDMAKTRAQVLLQQGGGGGGAWGAARDIVHARGVRGLYQGWSLQVFKEQIGNVGLFGAYELASRALQAALGAPGDYPLVAVLSGSAAGVAYQTIGYPLETVKNVLQTQPLDGGGYRTGGECLRALLAEGGWRRLVRGLSMSIVRAVPGAGAQFFTFETVKIALGG